MKGADSLAAGLVLIAVSVGLTVAGVFVGGALGSKVAGGFVGGIVGLVAGFRVVYRVYMQPLRDASLETDYSHLKPQWDDDE